MKLYEDCTKQGFYILEKYYGGGIVEFTESNCIDILKICVYYNEEGLLKPCIDYILNHKTGLIICNILKNRNILNFECLKNLKKDINDYLEINGCEFLNNCIIFIIFRYYEFTNRLC